MHFHATARLSPATSEFRRFGRLSKVFLVALLLAAFSFPIPISRAASADDAAKKLAKQARKLIREGNYQAAESVYLEALESDPLDAEARLGLAHLYLRQRNLNAAYHEASKVAAESPLTARAYSLMGISLIRSGLIDQAYEPLKTALKLNGRDDIAMAAIAEVAYYENRLPEADRLLNDALAVNYEEPDYHLMRARVASRLERFRDAANALRDFLRYSPKTDTDRRDRIEGVIRFYTYLGDTHTNNVVNDRTTVVPLTIRGRRPYVQAKVNGKGPVTFVVDTGAGISVMTPRAAQLLGIKSVAQGGNARAVGGSGTFPIVYGLLNSLEIGDVKVTTVPIYLREIYGGTPQGPNAGADGVLGLSVFTEFLLTLDYQKKEMKLERTNDAAPPTDTADGPASVVPFRVTESGLISVETQLDDGGKMNFILDSGASTTVISNAVVDRLQWRHKIVPDEKIHIVGAAGITQDVDLLMTKSVTISDLTKSDTRLPVLDLVRLNESSGFEQHGILGGDFLNNCRIQIDFRKQNILVTPLGTGVKRRPDAELGKDVAKPLLP